MSLPEVVGHRRVLESVPSPLPQVVLLVGPSGVGKSLVALHLAMSTGVQKLDYYGVPHLMRADAADVIAQHRTRPVGDVKVTIINISKAQPDAMNVLLKLLEEPPSYSRLILVSNVEPPMTVKSRCFMLRFGLLSTADVEIVLKRLHAAVPAEAARRSGGRVSVGLEFSSNADSRDAVERVLQALVSKDGSALESEIAKAMEARRDDDGGTTEGRRHMVVRVLSEVIRMSFRDSSHPLARTTMNARTEALKILESRNRPAIRFRAAVWILASGAT